MNYKSNFYEVDALDLLMREQDAIRQLFWRYERPMRRLENGAEKNPDRLKRKAEMVGQICFRLTLHMQIEDEIFYPAVRTGIRWNALLNDALFGAVCSHGRAKALIARLDEMESDDPGYDPTVVALGTEMMQHMNDEQDHIFPKVRMARLDTLALGRKIRQHRRALHEDVTRIGVPHGSSESTGIAYWSMASRVERGADIMAQNSWAEFL